jgi:hypothetical protein
VPTIRRDRTRCHRIIGDVYAYLRHDSLRSIGRDNSHRSTTK